LSYNLITLYSISNQVTIRLTNSLVESRHQIYTNLHQQEPVCLPERI